MPNYVFAFHGGTMPETPEEGEKVMKQWMDWYKDMGDAVVDGGAPVGMSKTVSSSGVKDDGGANPLSGYSVVKADSHDMACELAKGCPALEKGGSVEVAECMEM